MARCTAPVDPIFNRAEPSTPGLAMARLRLGTVPMQKLEAH
jgi:hypothetical protein